MELKRIALGQDTSTCDRLSALRELLKLEPSASKEVELGSVWHVHPDRIVPEEESDAPGGEHGELELQAIRASGR